jgi:hypothetical protein
MVHAGCRMTAPPRFAPGSALAGMVRLYQSPHTDVLATAIDGRALDTVNGPLVDFATARTWASTPT